MKQFCMIIALIFILIFSGCSRFTVSKECQKPSVVSTTESNEEKIKTLFEKKSYDHIIELYNSNEIFFDSPTTIKYLAKSYFAKDMYDNLIKTLEGYLKKNKMEDREMSFILGASYYETGKHEIALKNLNKALDLGLKNDDVFIYMACSYLKKGQYSLALKWASEVSQPRKYYLQGLIYAKAGNWKSALEKFNTVQDMEKSKIMKSYALYMLDMYDECIDFINKNLLNGKPDIELIKALIFAQKGEILKSKQILEMLVEKEKNNERILASAWKNIGIIYEIYFDNSEKAKEIYKKSMDIRYDEDIKNWLKN